MMNSCAYEEKMKRVEIYQSWLQEKQGKNLTTQRQQVELLCRLCDLQISCGSEETFLSGSLSQNDYQKMIFLWSNCKEMKQSFAEQSKDVQALLSEYAKFAADMEKGWQPMAGLKKNNAAKGAVFFTDESKDFFKRKLEKSFDQAYYIGDIAVNECEYEFLLSYTKDILKSLAKSGEKFRNDPLIVIFMVQVAICHYKGKYWGAFFEQLKMKVDPAYKNFLEKTLIYTLQKNNKYIVNKNERLNTIFFHAFFCDHYANAWFELLLQYYMQDLNGSLVNNTAAKYHVFLQGLLAAKNDDEDWSSSEENVDDSYLLRTASVLAMAANEELSFIKVSQTLELLHSALELRQFPQNSTERVQKLFWAWCQDSYAFKRAYDADRSTDELALQLRADLAENKIYLHLPKRCLNNNEKQKPLYWQIRTNKRTEKITPDLMPTLSGANSAAVDFAVNNEELFGRLKAELFLGEEKIEEVLFKGEKLRLFDRNGCYCGKLLPGVMYAYTHKETSVQSFALTKRLDLPGLVRYQLNCAADEVLVIDNYEVRVLGTGYDEGLNARGKVNTLTAVDESGRSLAVYATLPVLSITVQANKINASSIIINSSRYNLRSCRLVEFEKPDSKGVKVVLVDLRDMPSFKDGKINRVSVDIIASNSLKSYSFVYCQDLAVQFLEAPYVFAKEATVSFNYPAVFKKQDKYVQRMAPNTFSCALADYEKVLRFAWEKEKIDFELQVPAAMYSIDKINWQSDLPRDILAEELPEVIYLKNIAAEEITLELSQRFSWKIAPEEGVFTCDLLPILAALNYFSDSAEMALLIGDKRYPLMRIHLYNYVRQVHLVCDYMHDQLILKCQIAGSGQFCADIFSHDAALCEKQELTNGELQIRALDLLEEFTVCIYQKLADDDYRLLASRKMRPFDQADISDCQVLLKAYSEKLNSDESIHFGEEYVLYDLQTVDENIYSASLAKKYGTVYLPWLKKAEAEFYYDTALSKCYVTFYQEEDDCYNDFLLDLTTDCLATEEETGMDNEEKYRRYKLMFDGDCVFHAQVLPAAEKLSEAEADKDYALREIGFKDNELTVLQNLGYKTLAEIDPAVLEESLAGKMLQEKLTAKVRHLQEVLLSAE